MNKFYSLTFFKLCWPISCCSNLIYLFFFSIIFYKFTMFMSVKYNFSSISIMIIVKNISFCWLHRFYYCLMNAKMSKFCTLPFLIFMMKRTLGARKAKWDFHGLRNIVIRDKGTLTDTLTTVLCLKIFSWLLPSGLWNKAAMVPD